MKLGLRLALVAFCRVAAWAFAQSVKSCGELGKATMKAVGLAGDVRPAAGFIWRVGNGSETFVKAENVPVNLPLSGRAMSFVEAGTCSAGC